MAGASIGLEELPRLPASSVDDWGFELRQNSDVRNLEARREHAEWEEALRKYTKSLYDFLETSTPYLLANPHLGRPSAGGHAAAAKALEGTTHPAHAATSHLAEALKWLRQVQTEFRSRFARFTDAAALSQLEADEHDRLWAFWNVWFQFADRPKQHFGDARRESLAEASSVLKRRLAELKRRLASIAEAQVIVHQERPFAKGGQGLWLTMSLEESGRIEPARDATFAQITEALRPSADFHAFDRYVLDLVWRDVHVIPLVRGKSLAGTAWSFPIAVLPQPGQPFEAWQLMERPVDQDLWKELNIDLWPVTLGGAPRRLQAEMLAIALFIDTLLRLENAPEPDAAGQSILLEHRNQNRSVIVGHARNAASAAAECPATLFSDDDALTILRTYCEQIASDVDALELFAYDELRKISARVNEFLSGTLATIVHAAIDNELFRLGGAHQESDVNQGVPRHDRSTGDPFKLPRHSFRIHERPDVMLDEAAFVGFAGAPSTCLLQRSERTRPAGEIHDR
ncbi:MAG TPA: hypothetical protein VKB93_08620 [Thermoanaerobaculia bacterium]|nr:hypothetical protein [Thermoanaerobaculia bacterium]